MPPKGKAKNVPNQHDKRHEGGLAAPGKRVTKRTSNGNLHAQANGKPVQTVAPPPLPTTGLNQGFTFSHARDAAPLDSTAQTTAREHVGGAEGVSKERTPSELSVEGVSAGVGAGVGGGGCVDGDDGAFEQAPTNANADTHYAAGSQGYQHAAGSFAAVSTILSSYPLRDAISILILLLTLPASIVLAIQALFTSLTFVPPSANFSLSNLPSVKELFNSSNLGNPAIFTIVIVDVIFYLGFLLVWRPLQGVFLDLSYAVIAVSLSGAAASTGGPTYSIATCSLIVCVAHVLRYKAIHLTALDYLRSVLHKMDIGIALDGSFGTSSSYILRSSPEPGWIHHFLRGALGLHIVSQGVTTYIRRSLANANERNSNVPAITRSDPEATAGTEQAPRSGAGQPEGAQHAVTATSSDGRPPGPSPSHRDTKTRESSTKRKRKQATQVRSQQPLWAAIASTKVTFVKEMEQRDAADDAKEVAFLDTNTNTNTNFTNAISTYSGRIWVCEIRDTEVVFTIELSSEAAGESVERMEEGMVVSSGIDKSKPFFTRVNGAAWTSVRIWSSEANEDANDSSVSRYEAEIFGLAPWSSYHCEVVGIASQRVVCSASLITQSAPAAEQTASTPLQPQHQALRPSSPITTLKQSIQSAEAKLHDTRNKSKKTKKDQKAINSDIKKEITSLKTKVESSGGMDDKNRNRATQIRQHKNQAEEAAEEIKEQISSFGGIPADEVAHAETKRKAWQAAKDVRTGARHEYDSAKNEADREASQLSNELSAAESKREKLAIRHQQKAKELEKVQAEQEEKMTARQRYEFERAKTIETREQEERQFQQASTQIEAERVGLDRKIMDNLPQIYALQTQLSAQMQGYSSPPTPETNMAHINDSMNSPTMPANGFGAYGSQPFPPFNQTQTAVPNPYRGRSSSMLSQYSGFTEDGDPPWFEPPKQYSWPLSSNHTAGPVFEQEHNQSEGSGSGTASGSGSGAAGSTASSSPRPDARPFVPVKPMSPIGPPNKNKDKTPQSPGQGSAGGSSSR